MLERRLFSCKANTLIFLSSKGLRSLADSRVGQSTVLPSNCVSLSIGWNYIIKCTIKCMRERILVISGFLLSFSIGFMVGQIILIKTQKVNTLVNQVVDRSLDKYTIENLSKSEVLAGKIEVQKELKDYPNFVSNEFTMEFDPTLATNQTKKVSGMINIPKDSVKHPLIVMIRGYVDLSDYFIGNGTINSSIFFANHGFITISPDFL